MDIKTGKSLHYEKWMWVAENPQQTKYGWHRWEENGGDIAMVRNACFLCEIARGSCNDCPVIWPDTPWCVSGCERGLYDRYFTAYHNEDWTAVSLTAKKIANLPWKDDND